MTPRLFLLGKSTYALSIILDMLPGHFREAGLISNIPDEENTSLAFPYLSPGVSLQEYTEEQLADWQSPDFIIASIGKSRRRIKEYFCAKYHIPEDRFIPLIHPSSVTGNGFSYGPGLHISPLSVIAPYCTFGRFVVINRQVSVGHHTVLQDYVTVNPGVTISGICEIGEQSVIGAGATIIDKIKIGANSIIGAGSLVTKDIPDGVIAYGNPAKVIRDNIPSA
jgi:sugar O-acyltransferase (sialic acid O-acetyltransferase NeuD family)